MAILLEMASDVVCPWCWLGLRRVGQALELLGPDADVEFRLRPFELDPDVPAGGVPYRDYMRAKFGPDTAGDGGGRSRFSAMREALESYGEKEGIAFRFDGIPMRPNTFNAHRVIRWAQGQGLGMKAAEVLFSAYFSEHRDIGDKAELARLSESIGLQPDVVEHLLAGDADVADLREEMAFFRQLGISAAPTFIAGRRYAMQGAQDAEAIVELVRSARQADGNG